MFYELGGGGPERARIVCCFLGCDERPFNPLLTALPAVIHLSSADDSAPAGWLGTLLSMAAKEAGSARAGAENGSAPQVRQARREVEQRQAARGHQERERDPTRPQEEPPP